jgi:O-antigen/teichoic acid export membrane protein
MAGSVVALTEVLSAFGFDWALVRVRNPTRAHYDSAWSLRVLSGLVTFAVLAVAAHPAALYFHQPAIAWIIIALAANGLLSAVENIGIVDFRRHMRFDLEFRMRIAGKVAGVIAAVGWAVATHSYWALVIGITATRLTSVVLSYVMHDFRPHWDISQRGELLNFSVWLLLGNAVEAFRARFADLWLGRHLGSASVGLYSMASELSALASTEFAAPINRAVYTTYLELGDDLEALRTRFLRVSGLIWAIGVPAAVGLGVCAKQIVAVLLGSQWHEAARVLGMLAIAGGITVTASNTHYVYWALGRPKFVTVLSMIGTTAFVALTVVLGNQYGLLGVAGAQVLASSLVVVLNYVALVRTLNLRIMELLSRNWRPLLASLVMAVAIGYIPGAFAHIGVDNAAPQLAAMVISGVCVYFASLGGIWIAFSRPPGPESDVFEFIQNALRRVGLFRKHRDTRP